MFHRKASDPSYADLREGQIPVYQEYLDALFAVVDVHNYTDWSMSKPCDNERLWRDDGIVERVCCEEAPSHGLSPAVLQTMMHQYFFADPSLREKYQSKWAETVVYDSDEVDFFPSAAATRKLLEAFHTVQP